jgi:ketosteroid isomerase-like protein
MQSTGQDETQIQDRIESLYAGLADAFNTGAVNADSLLDAYYTKDGLYVTPWGWTEPLDTTKARLRSAKLRIKDYQHRIESMKVKSYGNAAYAFFVLRQSYKVNDSQLDEYLPTTLVLERSGSDWKIVHTHRSTDYETISQYTAMQKKQGGGK